MFLRFRLLICVDWFTPAYNAGGPIQSIHNLVDLLKDECKIFIITSNRDYLESDPLVNVKSDVWYQLSENVNVYYASAGKNRYNLLKETIEKFNIDRLYLNSMFSLDSTIKPLIIAYKLKLNIFLSPRGMLKDSALKVKPAKKVTVAKSIKKAAPKKKNVKKSKMKKSTGKKKK